MTGKKKQRKSMENKSNAQKNTLLQFAQGNRTYQKLQESIFFLHPRKIKKQKISPVSKK
jgi:hypothetical protein